MCSSDLDISVERTTVDNMETTRYFFHEGPDVSIGKGAVDQIQPGLRLTVNHDEGAIYINTLADVEGFRGGSALLLERAIGDMAERLPPGYRVYSDTHMSESAVAMIESLSEQGFGVVKLSDGVKVRTDEAGIAHHISQDGYPLYEITDVPGYMVAIPIVDDVGKFGVENFSKTLDDTYALVGAAKASLDDANARLTANIGWNPDRQTSIYKFRNTPGSKLNRQIKQLQTRMDRVLTGADRTEAGRILNTVVKQEQDEFGETVFRGLTEDMLDLGNLMRARETLNSIADRTGDLEITSFVNTIDEILTSGKFLDTAGRPVGLDIANALDNMIVTTRAAQSRLSYAESRIVRNNIFAKSDDGQYLNVNLKELGTYLRSGSKFFKHLKPVLESNPSAVGDLQNAVGDLYRDQVLSGTGWTKGKHDTFLRNYDTALKELFDDEAINAFRSTNFDSKGKNLFLSRIEDSRAALNRLSEMGTLDPTDILGSLNKIGGTSRRGAWRYLKEVERLNPKLAAQIKNDAIEQTRRYLQNTFFDPVTATKGPIQMSKELESWLATNNNTLRALHGDQYVTDLGAVVRAHKLDARRARIGAQKPQDQSDTIRTSRTILGPLSRLQRRITAGNWIKIRLTAKRALDVYSDPAKLRQLRASKAVPARSRPGIAVLARIGLIPGTGWDGQGDLPQDVYDKGIEFLDWVQDVSEQQEADQEEFELQGNTPYGREVIRSAKRPAHPVHIDGTPYEQYLREAQASR